MIPLLPGVIAFTPLDEISLGLIARRLGVKPLVVLAVGGILAYLAVTGKAQGSLKAVFGK